MKKNNYEKRDIKMSQLTENPQATETMLDEAQTAKILNIAVQTLRNWRFQGKGPGYYKFGKAVRYSDKTLGEFKHACMVSI